ncbi:hypothetical protein TNCV_2970801 [Trichonephila clavipes]|nr:hypothetical protein TNCV_2970801 [Trichonephila clavipes]
MAVQTTKVIASESEIRVIVRLALTTSDVSLSTIQPLTGTLMTVITIDTRLNQRGAATQRTLRRLSLAIAHCQERNGIALILEIKDFQHSGGELK